MRISTLIAVGAAALLLAACGIKGSLYMPEVPTAPATAPAADDSKPAAAPRS